MCLWPTYALQLAVCSEVFAGYDEHGGEVDTSIDISL